MSQVLNQFADRIGLLIELKNPMLYQGIEKKLAEILKKKGRDKPDYRPQLVVHSFDAVSMHIFHQFSSLVPVGILIDSRQRITPGMLSRFAGYASYVNRHKSLIGPQQVRRIQRFNMGVIAWTAERRNDIPHLLRAGVWNYNKRSGLCYWK